MVKDPEFIADAVKRRAELDPLPGVEVQQISDGMVNAQKPIVQMAIDGLK